MKSFPQGGEGLTGAGEISSLERLADGGKILLALRDAEWRRVLERPVLAQRHDAVEGCCAAARSPD
jgi:hypothetical protein